MLLSLWTLMGNIRKISRLLQLIYRASDMVVGAVTKGFAARCGRGSINLYNGSII